MKNYDATQIMKLADAPSMTSGMIIDMEGDDAFLSRASGRGLTPGAEVLVFQNYRSGPIIIHLRDSQIALGRKEARQITISR